MRDLAQAFRKNQDAQYGKFRAVCVDIHDPVACGRIRVTCPAIYGEDWSDWASPCFTAGSFLMPKEGDGIWIEFEGGDTSHPIWTGVYYDGLHQEDGSHAPWQEFHSQMWTDKGGAVIDPVKEHRDDPIDNVEQTKYQHSYYDPCVFGMEMPGGSYVRISEEPKKEYMEFRMNSTQKFDGKGAVFRATADTMIFEHEGLGCYIKFSASGIEIFHPSAPIFVRGTTVQLNDDK